MLSPVNRDTNPPLLGTNDANSAIDLAAIEDFSTASALTFSIDLEYSEKAGPNLTNSIAKSVRVLSPVSIATKPPLLGTKSANLAKAIKAFDVFSITLASTPFIVSAYCLKYGAKAAISLPKFSRGL